jgi:uncharacterized protein YbbK (DUF523 family)
VRQVPEYIPVAPKDVFTPQPHAPIHKKWMSGFQSCVEKSVPRNAFRFNGPLAARRESTVIALRDAGLRVCRDGGGQCSTAITVLDDAYAIATLSTMPLKVSFIWLCASSPSCGARYF